MNKKKIYTKIKLLIFQKKNSINKKLYRKRIYK